MLKVDWFLKIVWKILKLYESIRLIYKIRNFLTNGLELFAIWHKCLVVTDHRCEKWVLMSSCNQNKVREMVTHLGTHLLAFDTSKIITNAWFFIKNQIAWFSMKNYPKDQLINVWLHTCQVSRFCRESHDFGNEITVWLRNFSRISIKTNFPQINTIV